MTLIRRSEKVESKVLNMSSVAKPVKHLVNGYISMELAKQRNDDHYYPTSLRVVIMTFVGNICMRFDTIHEDYKDHIKEHGSILERPQSSSINRKDSIYYIACSSTSFSSGIHEFRILCNNPKDDAIGIISDISNCTKKNLFWTKAKGNIYYYYGDGQISHKTDGDSIKSIFKDIKPWNKNDIIIVNINCNKWTINFYKDDKQNKMGTEINIKPNTTYYPMIATQNHDTKYEIIDYNEIMEENDDDEIIDFYDPDIVAHVVGLL